MKSTTFLVAFEIGELVYVKTDTEQKQRIVVALFVQQGSIKYLVACGTEDRYYFDFELAEIKNELIKL